jgi:flagellar basal body-associated protein FliL
MPDDEQPEKTSKRRGILVLISLLAVMAIMFAAIIGSYLGY